MTVSIVSQKEESRMSTAIASGNEPFDSLFTSLVPSLGLRVVSRNGSLGSLVVLRICNKGLPECRTGFSSRSLCTSLKHVAILVLVSPDMYGIRVLFRQ